MNLRELTRNAASAERARSRLQREGVAFGGRRLWTDQERQVIVKHDQNYDLLCILLPHRTRAAIKKEAYNLRPNSLTRYWTAAEVSKLRKLYPSAAAEEICATFPWTDWFHIRQVAQYHGFRRKRKTYKITGIEALDAVRQRCFEIGGFMSDLDKAARTKHYFTSAGWSHKKINYRALGRAIEALDGVLRAQWN